jgi:hypothetical protein
MVDLTHHHEVVLLASSFVSFTWIQDFFCLIENSPPQVVVVFLTDISQLNCLLQSLIDASFPFQWNRLRLRPKFIKDAFGKTEDCLKRLASFFSFGPVCVIWLRMVNLSKCFLEKNALKCVHGRLMRINKINNYAKSFMYYYKMALLLSLL